MVFDGLTSSFDGQHMVQQASHVSRELGISREEQDEWAYRSQRRAADAQEAGRFDDEIVAVGERRCRRDHPCRHDAREARRAEAGLRPGRDDDRGQRARSERRSLVRGRLLRGVRPPPGSHGAGDDRLAGVRRRRVRVPRPDAGPRGRAGPGEGGQDHRRRRSASRSTRHSPRWPRTRRACSEPTRRS